MKILLACEESQAVCKEFRALGHEAFSCDILPCSGGHPEWHLQQDVTELLKQKWDMVIAFPPCTYLTTSANKWYKDQPKRKSGALVGEERRNARIEAIKFFMDLYNCGIPKIAIENPIGIMSSEWRKPDQIIQPWMFGDKFQKSTCLWLKGLPKLKHTDIVEKGEFIEFISKKGVKKKQPKWYAYASKEDRARVRSKTFPGIAKAMAEQWGK